MRELPREISGPQAVEQVSQSALAAVDHPELASIRLAPLPAENGRSNRRVVAGRATDTTVIASGDIEATDNGSPRLRPEASHGHADNVAAVGYGTFNGVSLPVSHRSGDGVAVEVRRNTTSGAPESLTLRSGQQVIALTLNADGSVAGRPGTRVTFDNAGGSFTIETRERDRRTATQFKADGTRINTVINLTDNSQVTTIVLQNRTVIVQHMDGAGAHTRIEEIPPAGQPIAYSRVGLQWQRAQEGSATQRGSLTLGADGTPRFVPQEAARPADRLQETSGQQGQRQRNNDLQAILVSAWPSTLALQRREARESVDAQFAGRYDPRMTGEQRQSLDREHAQALRAARERIDEQVRQTLEAIQAEMREGRFGPATARAYSDYVRWLQSDALPGTQRLSLQVGIYSPADTPLLLPSDPRRGGRPMDPTEYSALIIQGQAPALNLGLHTDRPPTREELARLGQAVDWMNRAGDRIQDARRDYEIDHVFPAIIEQNHLPEGWRWQPGTDREAYRARFRRVSDAALRMRNLIIAVHDSGLITNVGNLDLPPGVRIVTDSANKVVRVDMNLPATLSVAPENQPQTRAIEQWLATRGREVQSRIDEVVGRLDRPQNFLYWGDVEVPGYTVRGADGREHRCNLLEGRFDVQEEGGKIKVTYRMTPQNAQWFSYLNLVGVQDVTAARFQETRLYDPEEFVVVRRGMQAVELVKAKDLAAWRASQMLWHYGEKTGIIAMDALFFGRASMQARAARAALDAGRITARQYVMQLVLVNSQQLLAATGVLNNAAIKEHPLGRAFLLTRAGIFTASVLGSFPGQVADLAGRTRTAHGFMAALLGTERVHQELARFNWVAREGLDWGMSLAGAGFVPLVVRDVADSIERTSLRRSIRPFLNSSLIISGNRIPDSHEQGLTVLQNYADALATTPESRARLSSIVRLTRDLIQQNGQDPDANRTRERTEQVKAQLMTYLRPAGGAAADSQAQVMAASALLLLNRDRNGALPVDGVLATRSVGDRTEPFTLDNLADLLKEMPARAPGLARFAAAEVLVNAGAMSEHVYGRMLLQARDNGAAQERDWIRSRSEFVERSLQAQYQGEPGSELDLARRLLESYERRFATRDGATRQRISGIVNETTELLRLKETRPEEFQRRYAQFQARLAACFRTEGADIAAISAQASSAANAHRPLTDADARRDELRAGGPLAADERGRPRGTSAVDKDVQVMAAAALLLLGRDRNGNFPRDGVLATRQITVPRYTWTEIAGQGTEHPAAVTHTVPEHGQTQQVLMNDLVALLRQDVENPQAGSRRLVTGDLMVACGAMSAQVYAGVLRQVLLPANGQSFTRQDRDWALERLACIANAARVVEAYQDLTMTRDRVAEARGRTYGANYADLVRILDAVAASGPDADARAKAAAVLHALRQTDPSAAQREITGAIASWRTCAGENGAYARLLSRRMQADLASGAADTRLSAALTLDRLGAINARDYNRILTGCLDERNPQATIDAIKSLKLAGDGGGLLPAERQAIVNLLNSSTTLTNQEVKLAVLERLAACLPADASDASVASARRYLEMLITPEGSAIYAREFPRVRAAAATALGAIAGRQSAAALFHAADSSTEPSAEVRLAAVNALVATRTPLLNQAAAERLLAREFSPSVQARLQDIRWQVKRPPEGERYNEIRARAQTDLEVFQRPRGSLLTPQAVRDYLGGRALRSLTYRAGQASLLTADGLQEYAHNRWFVQTAHTENWWGVFYRAGSNVFGDGMGEARQRQVYSDCLDEAKREFASVVNEARSGDMRAISALAHIAKDPTILSPAMSQWAQEQAAGALKELCQPGSLHRQAAFLAIRENLREGANPRIKQLFLEALDAMTGASTHENVPYLRGEMAASILLEALSREQESARALLDRKNSSAADGRAYQESANYQSQILQRLSRLECRAYLPQIEAVARSHPMPEVRQAARQLQADFAQRVQPLFRQAEPGRATPADRARSLEQVLLGQNRNRQYADDVVREIFTATRGQGAEMTDGNDPRIPLLVRALADNDLRVKLAAAWVLTDRSHTGVSDQVRLQAITAAAQVRAYGDRFGLLGYIQDTDAVLTRINQFERRAFSEQFSRSLAAARSDLARGPNLDGLPRERHPDLGSVIRYEQPNGSIVYFNESHQVVRLLLPARPGELPAYRDFRYDNAGNLIGFVSTDRTEYTRVRDGQGRLTDRWEYLENGQRKTCRSTGDLVASDGTYSFVTGNQKKFLFSDGTSATITYGADGRPAQIKTADGYEFNLVWQNGRLMRFGNYNRAGNTNRFEAPNSEPRFFDDDCISPDGDVTFTTAGGRRVTWYINGADIRLYTGRPGN